jgi:hypothetical protein
MKKTLIGISVVLVSVFVIILAVNAQNNPQETRKSNTEVSKDCPKGPNASGCCKMKYGTAAEVKPCDQSKGRAMGCDPAKCKEGKCTYEGCKAKCETASGAGKKCDQANNKDGSMN